jgi:hypothetical protein
MLRLIKVFTTIRSINGVTLMVKSIQLLKNNIRLYHERAWYNCYNICHIFRHILTVKKCIVNCWITNYDISIYCFLIYLPNVQENILNTLEIDGSKKKNNRHKINQVYIVKWWQLFLLGSMWQSFNNLLVIELLSAHITKNVVWNSFYTFAIFSRF